MLDDQEWNKIEPLLAVATDQIKQDRKQHGLSLTAALTRNPDYFEKAQALYFEITNFSEKDPNRIRHHRISLLGAPCQNCGKPLRTPRAKICAECGHPAGA